MKLRHLEIFKVVCKHMSITKAAEELYMTQPAVSMVIKELEDYYHTKLFDRISRKIYLTHAGEKLLIYTNNIMNQLDLSISDIRDQQNLVSCNIGVNVTIGEGYLSNIIHHLKTLVPHLNLFVSVDNVKNLEVRFANNEFDFIITDSPYNVASHHILEHLASEQMSIVCAPTFTRQTELTIHQLSNYPLLLRESGSGCRRVINSIFEKHDCTNKPKIESVSHLALIDLAINNQGIAIIPTCLVKNHIEAGRLKAIQMKEVVFYRDYYLVYHDSKYISPTIKQCIEKIKELFKKQSS